MTNTQFIFSLATGLALASAGFAMASSQFADWGLFWVGVAVASVALADQFHTRRILVPVTVEAER